MWKKNYKNKHMNPSKFKNCENTQLSGANVPVSEM